MDKFIHTFDPGHSSRVILKLAEDHAITVVTGLRWKVQLESVKAKGGITICIERPTMQREPDYDIMPTDFHFSIHNEGSLQQLHAVALDILTSKGLL